MPTLAELRPHARRRPLGGSGHGERRAEGAPVDEGALGRRARRLQLAGQDSAKISAIDAHAHACSMPLAFLLKLVQSSELGAASQAFAWLDDVRLAPQNLAFVGLRDVDAEERKILLRLGSAAPS